MTNSTINVRQTYVLVLTQTTNNNVQRSTTLVYCTPSVLPHVAPDVTSQLPVPYHLPHLTLRTSPTPSIPESAVVEVHAMPTSSRRELEQSHPHIVRQCVEQFFVSASIGGHLVYHRRPARGPRRELRCPSLSCH